MKSRTGSRELYKPQGCLPLWPEEEAEVYPSHSSTGDATAFDLQVTGGNRKEGKNTQRNKIWKGREI